MKFAVIAPTKYLDQLSGQGEIQMCLAHEAVKNEPYRTYFQKKKSEGQWVLIDNGAHEGERIVGQELVDLCAFVKPSCVIMPDVLDNYEDTRKDTLEFHENFGSKVLELGVDLMAVPQGKTYEEFLENYKTFSQLEGVKFIGVSYTVLFNNIPGMVSLGTDQEAITVEEYLTWLTSKTKQQMMRRFFLLQALVAEGVFDYSKNHHLLGMSNPLEFVKYVYTENVDLQKAIHSCDTTLCFGMGVKNRIMDSSHGMVGEREGSWEEFASEIELTNSQVDCINHNIQVCKLMASLVTTK